MCFSDETRVMSFKDQVLVESQHEVPNYATNVSYKLNFTTTVPDLGLVIAFEFVDTVSCKDVLTVSSIGAYPVNEKSLELMRFCYSSGVHYFYVSFYPSLSYLRDVVGTSNLSNAPEDFFRNDRGRSMYEPD